MGRGGGETQTQGSAARGAGAPPARVATSTPADKHPERNEDGFYVSPDARFATVLDGVGGGGGGDEISAAAVRALERFCELSQPDSEELYDQAMWVARAYAAAQIGGMSAARAQGQGATVVMARRVSAREALICAAGDARAYAVDPSGVTRRLTIDNDPRAPSSEDDPALGLELDRAESAEDLTPDGYRAFRSRNIISSDLLSTNITQPYVVTLAEDEALLLCSDGIHDNLSQREIEAALGRDLSAESLVESARYRAREDAFRSKDDDITAVILAPPEPPSGER